MPNLVLTDTAALDMLQKYLSNTDIRLRLYANDVTFTDTSTTSVFEEVTGGGYSYITLSSGSWTYSTSTTISTATYTSDQTFTFTSASTNASGKAYGYYLTDTSDNLICAQAFVVSFTINSGGSLSILPTFKLSKGIPT